MRLGPSASRRSACSFEERPFFASVFNRSPKRTARSIRWLSIVSSFCTTAVEFCFSFETISKEYRIEEWVSIQLDGPKSIGSRRDEILREDK